MKRNLCQKNIYMKIFKLKKKTYKSKPYTQSVRNGPG